MKEQEFNKVISDIVIAFEKAGVYTPELKKTIDSLFDLKNAVLIRNAGGKTTGDCFRCANYDNGACSFLSALVSDSVNIELMPVGKDRVRVNVPMTFSCKFYKA